MRVLSFLRGRPAPRGNPDDGVGRSAPAADPGELAGPSAAMRALRAEVARYGDAAAPVLIVGESGTGKERVARALAAAPAWRGRPYVAVNAGAVPPGLLASELFGHARGAFSGAAAAHRGYFEQADGGTLFLDEVGELPPDVQVALLRVLEAGEVRPLGAERVVPVRVRVLAATHRDLPAMVRAGAFREDLFYRLHVLSVRVPPLRERPDDLPDLARSILAEVAPGRGASPGALARLAAFPWPGNVRQLRNVLWRAAIRHPQPPDLGAVEVEQALNEEPDLGPPPAAGAERPGVSDAALAEVWARTGGNVSETARLTGVSRSTVRDRVRRLGAPADAGSRPDAPTR